MEARKIVFATGNRGKLREASEILGEGFDGIVEELQRLFVGVVLGGFGEMEEAVVGTMLL